MNPRSAWDGLDAKSACATIWYGVPSIGCSSMMNGDAAVACFRTAATSPASAAGSRTSTTGNGSSDEGRVSHGGGRSARLNT